MMLYKRSKFHGKKSVCFTMSPHIVAKIKEHIEEVGMPTMAKFMIYLLSAYRPAVLYRDPFYAAKNRKMMIIKLTDAEITKLNKLCEEHQRAKAALGRDLAYTFFLEKEKKLKK
jgi:hypothetical protein